LHRRRYLIHEIPDLSLDGFGLLKGLIEFLGCHIPLRAREDLPRRRDSAGGRVEVQANSRDLPRFGKAPVGIGESPPLERRDEGRGLGA
jgi:hypothetical protein